MENLPTITQQSRPMAIIPADFESAYRMARIMAASGLMPKGIQSPEAVFVAMQIGAEIGLSPMASVQNIAVINGKPSIYGDAALAVVRASGQLEVFEEWSEGERKTPGWTFFCKIKRKGFKEVIGKYTWAQALDAGLDKAHPDTPWRKWTDRMMQFKARNFPLRDLFSDYLKGIRTAEENVDAIDAEFVDHAKPAAQVVSLKDKLNEKLAAIAIPAQSAHVPDQAQDVTGDKPSTGQAQAMEAESKPEEIKPANEWDDFRSQFINLKGPGFASFVFDNADKLRAAPINIKKDALDKWNKLYPTQQFPLTKESDPKPEPESEQLPERQSSVEQPVSFSREYKHMMDLKRDFPEFYTEAVKELGIGPDTISNCVNISALIGRKVDEQSDSAPPVEAYEQPAVTDTSGF